VGRKGKKIPAPDNSSSQQVTADGHREVDGATALPPTWVQLTEKDFPELPTAKNAPPQPQQPQQKGPRNNQRQQQLNDINLKLQQLSATAPPVNSGADQQRPLGARNKTVQRNNSRGSSKNNSRRTSRERGDGPQRNNNQGRRETESPPPFQSYFRGRSYNISEMKGTIQKPRSSNDQRQSHDQDHRKR
jgi:hypothetical protein